MKYPCQFEVSNIVRAKIKNFAVMAAGFCVNAGQVYAAKSETLTAQEVCRRLQITEEVLVLDAKGERVIDIDSKLRSAKGSTGESQPIDPKRPDVVCTKSSSSGLTSSNFEGPLYYSHAWYVRKDGTVLVEFEQGTNFQGRGRDSKITGSTGKQSHVLKDFQAISWVSTLHKQQRVVVRLIPSLADSGKVKELGKFPIVLDNAAVYDGKGRLWSASFSADGEFIAATTIYGGIMMSFQPFTGGKKNGRVSGREIKFKLDDGTTVMFKSDSLILPGDISAELYVMVDPALKAESISSQSVSTGSNADEILAKLRAHK